MAFLDYLVICLISAVVVENARGQTCGPTDCLPSDLDMDLTISPSKVCYSSGDQVDLSCSGNFGGPDVNHCLNGNWILPSATCDVFTCSRPMTGDALNLDPDKESYNARETVNYLCSQGYEINGPTSAVCDSQDVWNPATIPVCVASCEEPNIPNGGVTTSGPFSDGDSAQVECDYGYTLEAGSSSTISCDGGAWDSIPSCYASCNVTGIPNSDSESDINLAHGATATVSCYSGYSYGQQTTFTVNCFDGALDQALPEECYQDCTPLTPPADGSVSGGNLHGDTAYYTCDRGFLLNETDSATCYDGVWSNSDIPTCYGQSLENSITLQCNPDKFIVEIPELLLGDAASTDSISLGGTCSGTAITDGYLFVESLYNECGTTMEVDNAEEKVIYRNYVMSADLELVTTEESLTINVECVFDQNHKVSSTAVVQNVLEKNLQSTGTFDVSFTAYKDAGFSQVITDGDRFDTNEDIFLLAEVSHVTSIDLFGTRCYATPSPEPNYHVFYDLITDGCPVSEYVSDLHTDETTNPNFAFTSKIFRFTGSNSDAVYIHCDLKVCDLGECQLPTNCGSSTRRKRSTHISFSKHVFAGPISMRKTESSEQVSGDVWQLTALTVYSATISAMLLCAVVGVSIIIHRRRRQPSRKHTGNI